jgi:hypothetical protein
MSYCALQFDIFKIHMSFTRKSTTFSYISTISGEFFDFICGNFMISTSRQSQSRKAQSHKSQGLAD